MPSLQRVHLASTRGFPHPMGLLALTLLISLPCMLAGCGALPGRGSGTSLSIVGLWLGIASTVGLRVGCGGPR